MKISLENGFKILADVFSCNKRDFAKKHAYFSMGIKRNHVKKEEYLINIGLKVNSGVY